MCGTIYEFKLVCLSSSQLTERWKSTKFCHESLRNNLRWRSEQFLANWLSAVYSVWWILWCLIQYKCLNNSHPNNCFTEFAKTQLPIRNNCMDWIYYINKALFMILLAKDVVVVIWSSGRFQSTFHIQMHVSSVDVFESLLFSSSLFTAFLTWLHFSMGFSMKEYNQHQ